MKQNTLHTALFILCAALLTSCAGYKKIGALTLLATRNVNLKSDYVLLQKNVYGTASSKHGEAFQTAIDNAVSKLPNGEFLQNIRVYVKKDGKSVKVEGDLWGLPSITKSVKDTTHFFVGERVYYRTKTGKFRKGTIVSLYADQDMALIKDHRHKKSVAYNQIGKRKN